ncbi:SixA phosphatase family protein [Maribacter sp. 2210JD10-5]|uniref:SixA phosphatase family protein n=1 Tax=Maribacter sp. 2210JD10-5 TaxID=3386272 RepID=UPI0039BC3D48
MKNLILMRHGKSSWEHNVSDQDRSLLQRGVNDAHLIGAELSRKKIVIDYAFSSPANRALHTAMICLRKLGHSLEKFTVANELYDFSGDQVLDFLKGTSNTLNSIIIFGHNHAFTHLVNALGDNYIDNLPTSGLAQIQFKVDQWSSITKGKTILTLFPKHLR